MLIAAHNCQGYGVDVTIYMPPSDWDKIEREYEVKDKSGKVVY